MLIIIGKVPAHDPQCTYTSNMTRVLEGKKCNFLGGFYQFGGGLRYLAV